MWESINAPDFSKDKSKNKKIQNNEEKSWLIVNKFSFALTILTLFQPLLRLRFYN